MALLVHWPQQLADAGKGEADDRGRGERKGGRFT